MALGYNGSVILRLLFQILPLLIDKSQIYIEIGDSRTLVSSYMEPWCELELKI